MYGMINNAMEDMVTMHYGEATWERIRVRAGVDVEVFMSNQSYPDSMTYELIGAASEILKLPVDEILIGFGEHWILHTALKGYGGLMRASGESLLEFLQNLPNFHTRVAMVFPNLKPPRFEVSDIAAQSLNLHYVSDRPGLSVFVVGLLQGLGKMFSIPVTVEQIEFKDRGANHDVFRVDW